MKRRMSDQERKLHEQLDAEHVRFERWFAKMVRATNQCIKARQRLGRLQRRLRDLQEEEAPAIARAEGRS